MERVSPGGGSNANFLGFLHEAPALPSSQGLQNPCQAFNFQAFPAFKGFPRVLRVPKIFTCLHLQRLCRPHPVHQPIRSTCGGRPRPLLPLCVAPILLPEIPKLESADCGGVMRSEHQTWVRKRTGEPPC